MRVILDLETDGLLEEATVIYCISYYNIDNYQSKTLTDYNSMIDFLLQEDLTIIGHNIIRFDIPVANKLLNINIKARLIDTLGISWYLYPLRKKHGLEIWGDELGVEKPKIEDWVNQNLSDYINRCEQDVVINTLLWNKMIDYLKMIYETSDGINRILRYITFKLECAREQEEVGWKLDVSKCQENLLILINEMTPKRAILVEAMPVKISYKIIKRPKAGLYKKDGTLSVAGEKWVKLTEELGISIDEESFQIEDKIEPGNPDSPEQLKNWLFGLGWIPETFRYEKDKSTGDIRAVPQISIGGGDVCKSVKVLFEQEPRLVNLEGYTILTHRIEILQGFMKNKDNNDTLKAQVKGFTNTMRFQHTTLVNLPTIHKPYGKFVREVLIAPDSNYILCGSDMSSLEDNTKQHYMYYYDPDYVNEMRTPIFDPHIDIGVQGGLLNEEEANFYRWMDGKPIPIECIVEKYLAMTEEERKKEAKKLSGIRKDAKQVNFASVYGAGPPKIALSSGMSLEKAKLLHTIYWQRNWSVKKVSRATRHKTIDGQMWLFNPVSKFWYTLRYEKDKFSTLNQGTGVYCFDCWVRYVRSFGYKLCGQFHDEIIVPIPIIQQEQLKIDLKEAINLTNQQLKLNVELGISMDFGNDYSQIH